MAGSAEIVDASSTIQISVDRDGPMMRFTKNGGENDCKTDQTVQAQQTERTDRNDSSLVGYAVLLLYWQRQSNVSSDRVIDRWWLL